jgi:NAD(P)-dependent dehydrogenase (short-subunit alcohol dehydrogenase family)
MTAGADRKVALVTGAAGGIGRALCRRLVDEGWSVLAGIHRESTGIDSPFLREIPLDLGDEASISEAAASIDRLSTSLDLIVNCAGLNRPSDRPRAAASDLGALAAEALVELMRVNAFGPLLLISALVDLLGPGSTVVNLTSQRATPADAIRGGGKYGYRAGKAALESISIALAADLRDRDVRVHIVDVGWVRTRMGGEDAPTLPEEAARDLLVLIDRSGTLVSDAVLDREGLPRA